jgi:hypothetical protein
MTTATDYLNSLAETMADFGKEMARQAENAFSKESQGKQSR